MKFGVSLLNYRPGHVGGVETYIRRLIEAWSAPGQRHEITFIAAPDAARVLPDGARRLEVRLSGSAVIGWRCVEAFTPLRARALARRIDAAGYDAILFPQQSIFPIGIRTPAVLTVVDAQHLRQPQNYGPFDTRFRRSIYPRSLEKSRRIIAISEATKRDVVELCKVVPQKIDVGHMGFDPAPGATVCARMVEAPYFFYPAATFPHKGHADLLRCFARVKASGVGALKLVFSGMQTKRCKQLEQQVTELGLDGEVLHMGFVSHDQLESLFQHAEAILFPSEFEGFGMPVLEAVQYGKPVFCSDLPVFDEIGVPAENRLDFKNPDALVAIMDRLQPTVLRHAPISWSVCAMQTLDMMMKASKQGVK